MIFRSKKARDSEVATGPAAGGTPSRQVSTGLPDKASQRAANEAGPASHSEASGGSSDKAQRQIVAAIRHSMAFAQTVTLLMHSQHYKHYTLADLEWLVLPPLLTGQYSVAEAKRKDSGVTVPVAVALWASVSPEVDKRLSENAEQPMRLRPDEWRSGDILWLVDAVGDARIVPGLMKQLAETVFKGREVKVRARGADGKPAVQTLKGLQKQDIKQVRGLYTLSRIAAEGACVRKLFSEG